MIKHLIPCLLALLCCLAACRSAKKAYERGNYEEAVTLAIERLRRSPDNKKALNTLNSAYSGLVLDYEARLRQAAVRSDPMRFEDIYGMYYELNRVYNELQRTPAARSVLRKADSYINELETAREDVVRVRYDLGIQAMARTQREDAMEAYEHFRRVEELEPGYRNAARLAEEAREAATIVVAVEPIPMPSRLYQVSSEFFEQQLMEYLRSDQLGPFVRFEAPGRPLVPGREPDQLLRMHFEDFVVGQAYIKETERERSRDSVVVGEREVGGREYPVYGTVKATVNCFQKEISSSGLLSVDIVDAYRGNVLARREIPGAFVYYDYWGYFNGDERALREEDEDCVRKRNPSPDPPPQQLFLEFTRPIYDDLQQFLRGYYRQY